MLLALKSWGLFAYVLAVCLLSATCHHVSRLKLGNFGHHHKVRQNSLPLNWLQMSMTQKSAARFL
jgi:hypothetical protein